MSIKTRKLFLAVAISAALSGQALAVTAPEFSAPPDIRTQPANGGQVEQQANYDGSVIYADPSESLNLQEINGTDSASNTYITGLRSPDTYVRGGGPYAATQNLHDSASASDTIIKNETNTYFIEYYKQYDYAPANLAQNLYDNATANNTTLINSGVGCDLLVSQNLYNSSISTGTTLTGFYNSSYNSNKSKAEQNLYNNASANNTTINAAGYQNLYDSAFASGTTINLGGAMTLHNSATANNIIVNYGGTLSLYDSTTISNVILNSGELEIHDANVLNGVSNNIITNNAHLLVTDTASASNMTVSQLITAGRATASDIDITGHNDTEHSYLYDKINEFQPNNGNFILATNKNVEQLSLSTINNLTLNNGDMYVYTKGGLSNITLNGRSALQISKTSSAGSNNIILNDGGVMWVEDGITINNTTVNDRGKIFNAYATTNNTILNDNAVMTSIIGTDNDVVVNRGATYQTMQDGYYGSPDYTPLATNLTVNAGGTANINIGSVQDVTLAGVMTVIPDAQAVASDAAFTPSLLGNVNVLDGGELTLGAGAETSLASVSLAGTGALLLNNGPAPVTATTAGVQALDAGAPAAGITHTLQSLDLQGGSVHYDPTGLATLTLASLQGNGSFYMNTRVAEHQGDVLTVTGQATGQYDIHVADTGVSPSSGDSLRLIHIGSGDAAFTLANPGHVVDLGTWQYTLDSDGQNGWALTAHLPPEPVTPEVPATPQTPQEPAAPVTPADPTTPDVPVTPADPVTPDEPVTPAAPPSPVLSTPVLSPSAAAILAMASTDPLIFRAELEDVRSRQTQLRTLSRNTPATHDTGLWVRYGTGKQQVSDHHTGYDLEMNSTTLGMDTALATGTGTLLPGVFFTHGRNSTDFDRGGDGSIDTWSGGMYATWLLPQGWYLDGILKAGRSEHDVNARMNSGGRASGHYNTRNAGFHLQGGKAFRAGSADITPWLALSGFTGSSADYRLSNGMTAAVDNQHAMTAEAGVDLGQTFSLGKTQVHPWIRLGVEQGLAADSDVKINEDHLSTDLSGTRGVYQLGVEARITPQLTAQVQAGYAHGDHVDSPWNAGLGVAWTF